MSIQDLSDESVLRLYESIRQQVSADMALGGRHRLVGEAAKAQARHIREEIDRRRLDCKPIEW